MQDLMNPQAIGEKLIALRGEKSQSEVADALGISKSALSMYEQGERIPRDNIKIRISKYYATSIQALFFT